MPGVIRTSGPAPQGEAMKGEEPDWNFLCFVIALYELLAQAMTKL